MPKVGELATGRDDAGQHFVFGVCPDCAARLRRLEPKLRHRLLRVAINNMAEDPGLCEVRFFDDMNTAKLFCRLEAERLAAGYCREVTSTRW